MLFNIFIDSLTKLLDAGSHGEFQAALLLADDVKVHGLSDAQLQHQLDIVTRWSDENGMAIGHGKCAHQVPGGRFELAGQALQYQKCYKYLGFPHLLEHINFTTMLRNMAAKAMVILNHCRRIGDSWPEGIRLHVTKFFIRSRLEYGLPLAYASCEGTPGGYAKFNPIQNALDQCTRWILPYVNSLGVASMLCGLNSAIDRARGLGATFVHHLQKMPDDHPARKAIAYWKQNPPWSPGILLPRCASSSLHSELQRSMIAPPAKNYDTALRTWYHSQLSNLRLSTYISLKGRTSRGGPDKSLFIPVAHVRRAAILWRANLVWNVRYNCPNNHAFLRSCINNCRILDNVLIDRFAWLADADGNLDLPGRPPNAGEHYCILDDLLNRGYYEHFEYGIDHLMLIVRA
jgi:hypothetical protein